MFSVKYLDLGLDGALSVLSHPFFRRRAFVECLGEILVYRNLDVFADRLMSKKNYEDIVRAYNHNSFGMKTSGDELVFQCHASLIAQMFNDRLLWDIKDEITKANATITAPKIVKHGEEAPSICSYSDSSGLKLTVPKTNELRVCLERAMEYLLAHFGKNMDVLITDNMFSFIIDVTDKNK